MTRKYTPAQLQRIGKLIKTAYKLRNQVTTELTKADDRACSLEYRLDRRPKDKKVRAELKALNKYIALLDKVDSI